MRKKRQSSPANLGQREDVDLEDLPKHSGIVGLELTVRPDAGAIDHQVQRVKTAGNLVKEPLTVFLDGQIGGNGHDSRRVGPFVDQVIRDGLEPFGRTPGQDDLCAGFDQLFGKSLAQARRGTCDQTVATMCQDRLMGIEHQSASAEMTSPPARVAIARQMRRSTVSLAKTTWPSQ